ncbi:unnamed protein product [Schistosoma rodhaini]|uniref:Uncharacterized protein n=1 Tax=Schistosoma rodhaini TaxID=6188 RepID=A0AA85FDG6_9TREM|nr:unnamed protein product [Schistosoma rodhaini]
MLHLFLLLVLNPVFFEHVHGERQWDHFVFSLEWPPTYCFIQTCKLPYSINDFNIHGLWPSIWPHIEPKNCSNRTPFRIELIKPIYNDLQKQWANLIDFDNPEDFWKHEWSKHGVCAISDHPFISNELDYFNISLAIKSKVNLLSRLESVSITPNNLVTLKRDMLLDQLKNLFSVNVLIYCSLRKHEPGRLSEIRICLNPSLEFIDCPISSANKINDQQFSNHFYKTIYSHSVCKSLLPWLYQSPICLNQPSTKLSNNVPCPEELIFPKFN